ncbi:MAG: tetratricopeptide repeat protein [Planctomycetota bacterium]
MPLVCAAALLMGLAAAPDASAQGWPAWLGGSAEPGTPAWWKSAKGKAVFVPGSGYQVPGVEGFFDEKGRPINAPLDEVSSLLADGGEKPAGLLPGLDPKVQYRRVRDATGFGPDLTVAQQSLAEGQSLFTAKKYGAAARRFRTAADRAPGTPTADRALFLLGESYFFDDRYVEARDAYNELVEAQPNTRDLNTLIERQWAIAQYWERFYFDYKPTAALQPNLVDKTRPLFDTLGHAIKTYENIRLNDPTGPRADDAIMAEAGIYFRRGRYYDADAQYTLLREEYPRSEHQFEAHLLGLQSKLRKYQGPDYDGTPLKEAELLVKQIRTQFAGQLNDDEKTRLKQVSAELQLAAETRDLRMAQYYDNTEHYLAARHYYAKIARDYPTSPVGQQASARLAELGGKPDVPPERLAWFVDLFPENREQSRVGRIVERSAGETRLAGRAGAEGGAGVVPASAEAPATR